MTVANLRSTAPGLPDAAMRLARFGWSYNATWTALLAGRLLGYRDGRFWRVDPQSLADLERELAYERGPVP